jgi:hypothetical protein
MSRAGPPRTSQARRHEAVAGADTTVARRAGAGRNDRLSAGYSHV